MSTVDLAAGDGWADVVGQDRAVALLRGVAGPDVVHAWLFLGPKGSGKRAAARAFAGDLLAQELDERGDTEGAIRTRALARAEAHPDLMLVERAGAAISAEQADEIVRRASRSAIEGRRKVLVLDEFHLIADKVGPKLLKTVEEPTAGTFFVILAEDLPPELVTIASRCIKVEFAPLTVEVITAALVSDGIDADRVTEAAGFAGGDLDRARLLATDDRLALRLAGWRGLPSRLDGRGSTATAAVDDLRAAINDAEAPLRARHQREVADLDDRIERYGQRGSGAADLEKKHRRESRRFRTDELRMGLGSLAATYRDELVVTADPTAALSGLAAIQQAAEALLRNPNEELLLVALALQLPPLN